MAFRRTSIGAFSLANKAYVDASVAFYTVDLDTGLRTATLAVLYEGPTGAETLSNPQLLDSEGRFSVPVYAAEPVIGLVSGANVDNHDTGIIYPSLSTADVDAAAGSAAAAAASEFNAAASASSAAGSAATAAGAAAQITPIEAEIVAVAAIADDIVIAADNVADITNFADVYQGPKASDPTLRNDGSPIQVGDLYFNTVADEMRVRASSAWVVGALGTSVANLTVTGALTVGGEAISKSVIDDAAHAAFVLAAAMR